MRFAAVKNLMHLLQQCNGGETARLLTRALWVVPWWWLAWLTDEPGVVFSMFLQEGSDDWIL